MNKQTTTTTTTEAEVEETTEVLVLVTEQDAEKVLVESGLDRLMKQREQGVVNPIMLAQAIGVRPQMIYNYIRSGRIASVVDNNTQKKTIAWSVAVAFAQQYLNRKAVKAAKVERELAGQDA
jgi:hypothetical protein